MILKFLNGDLNNVHFLLFLLSYAVNPLILAFIPNELAVNFLGGFTAFNIIFSLLFTLGFSKIEGVQHQKKILTGVVIAVLILAVVGGLFSIVFAVAFLYPFSLLYGDYIMTQGGEKNDLVRYRFFLMLSGMLVVLAGFYYGQYFMEAVIARSLIILIYAFISIPQSCQFSNLKITSPIAFIINTYIFYSGALLLLVYLNEAGSVGTKHWYIALQVALGLLLKLIDFSVRKNGEIQKLAKLAVIALAGIAVVSVSYLHFSPINILVSIVAIAGLSRILFGIKQT